MKRLKKPTPTYKRLALIAAFLAVFTLGLVVAWLQPGAVLVLMIAFALVVLGLAVESFYLWQVARMQEFNRKNRTKRPVQRKEEAAQ